MATKIKIGIIGGSGLDNPDILKNSRPKVIENTPFGKPSDDLILGEIEGVECVLLARHGRKHDIMPGNINYRANIWAFKEEGCTHIIAATATGSLQERIKPGDLVILDSFIDRTQGRRQTFYDGEKNHPPGICHLPMEPAFNERTRQLIIETAKQLDIDVHPSGTVVSVEGPRFSSKAESNMFRQWGGHVINMTSVPEVVLAKEAGICYAAVALATDYDCWRDNKDEHVSVADVLATFKKNVTKVTRLITAVVPNIAKENWDETLQELQDVVKSSVML
ncbi:S-methyl-5'-thioadenosine phosphorylase [Asbolus verrucosus]|uniref:S-methyl-5'-thioadenosine phosphorylase n=1 Tax=Asbolus verrucosus TaxID=1661398 RepID=A0A482VU13_ASBVE|nr:S-methyl-5'-thioadenosine phosphorylase [Asbolus verrucosus]